MSLALAANKRAQSRDEEIANSISHGLALVAALVAAPLPSFTQRGGAMRDSLLARVSSPQPWCCRTLPHPDHALPAGHAKRIFRVIEHSAIFLLIAGTYAPFTLVCCAGHGAGRCSGWYGFLPRQGWAVRVEPDVPSRALHRPVPLMGGVIVIAAQPLIARVPVPGLLWLVAGGLAYTAGVIFFALD